MGTLHARAIGAPGVSGMQDFIKAGTRRMAFDAGQAGMPTIGEFLGAIYGSDAGLVWTAGFPQIEPEGGAPAWGGGQGLGWLEGRYGAGAALAAADADLFFCIGAMRPGADRRSNANVLAQPLLIVDDIGTKVPRERWEGLFDAGCPRPSFRVQTSPGNETWGWVLAGGESAARTPERFQDMTLMRAYLLERALTDAVMDEARYVRLPGGWNSKRKYRTEGVGAQAGGGVSPRVQLVEWRLGTDGPVDTDALGRALVGLQDWRSAPMPTGAGAALMNGAQLGAAIGAGALARSASMTAPDALILMAQELGMNPHQIAAGVVEALCPNHAQHTTRADTGFAFLGGGLMHCHHASCVGMRSPDFRAMLEAQFDALCEASRMVGAPVKIGGSEVRGAAHLAARVAFADGSGGVGLGGTGDAGGPGGSGEAGAYGGGGILGGSSAEDLMNEAARLAAHGAAVDHDNETEVAAAMQGILDRLVYVEDMGIWYDTVRRTVMTDVVMEGMSWVVRVVPAGKSGANRARNVLLNNTALRRVTSVTSVAGDRTPVVRVQDEKGRPAIMANVWQPGTVRRVAGGPLHWLALLQWVVPHAGYREYLLNWMAWVVQNPGRRMMTIPLLISGQGVGKDMLLGLFYRVLGAHNVQEVSGSALGERWNSWMTAQVVFLNELKLDAAGVMYNRIKELLSKGENHWVRIEEKFREPYPVRVACSMIAASNHDDALRGMEPDDRRWAPYKSPAGKADPAFYEACAGVFNDRNGEEAGRLMDMLLRRALPAGFGPHSLCPDDGGAKRATLVASLGGVATWTHDAVGAGGPLRDWSVATLADLEDMARAARIVPSGMASAAKPIAEGLRTAGWLPFGDPALLGAAVGGAVGLVGGAALQAVAGAPKPASADSRIWLPGEKREVRLWLSPQVAGLIGTDAHAVAALYEAERKRRLGVSP